MYKKSSSGLIGRCLPLHHHHLLLLLPNVSPTSGAGIFSLLQFGVQTTA
jgi:hypothetical protein